MMEHAGSCRRPTHASLSLHICLYICQSNETQEKAAALLWRMNFPRIHTAAQGRLSPPAPCHCPGKTLIRGINQKRMPGPWRRVEKSLSHICLVKMDFVSDNATPDVCVWTDSWNKSLSCGQRILQPSLILIKYYTNIQSIRLWTYPPPKKMNM